MKRVLLITSMFLLGLTGVGWGAVWYVTPGGSDLATGQSWDQAFQTIQKAVDTAIEADEIWAKEGTYLLDKTVGIRKAVAIYGGFGGTEVKLEERDWKRNVTIIDGNHRVSCFDVQASVRLDGFTIANGESYYLPGGVNTGSGSSPIIANCTFYANRSRSGGAMYNSLGSLPTIINCIFRENTATTYFGGAIYNYRSSPIILNSVFYGNVANRSGGGIYNLYCSPIVTNCTFYGNTAGSNGGGICNYFYSSPTIANSIFRDDQAPYGSEIDNSVGSVPSITYSNIHGGHPGSGNINADPGFVDPDGGDFHLKEDSVCVDKADLSAPDIPFTDFEGDPRVFGDKPDMGVDEVVDFPIEVHVDIRPGSCPNWLNVKSKGVLPVAILGTEGFEVGTINPETIQLSPEGLKGVFSKPVHWSLEDVGTPSDPISKEDAYDCNKDGPDGLFDLTLKFDTEEIVAALGEVSDGQALILHLEGRLLDEFGGRSIAGKDVVVILKEGK